MQNINEQTIYNFSIETDFTNFRIWNDYRPTEVVKLDCIEWDWKFVEHSSWIR